MLSPAFSFYLCLVHYKFGNLSDNLQFKQNEDFHSAHNAFVIIRYKILLI